jgi:hypothetical protein
MPRRLARSTSDRLRDTKIPHFHNSLLLRSDFLFVLSVFDTIYASSLVLSVRCASHNTASRVFGRYGVVTAGFPYLLVLELCTNGELLKHVKKEAHTTYHLLLILKDIAAGMT